MNRGKFRKRHKFWPLSARKICKDVSNKIKVFFKKKKRFNTSNIPHKKSLLKDSNGRPAAEDFNSVLASSDE